MSAKELQYRIATAAVLAVVAAGCASGEANSPVATPDDPLAGATTSAHKPEDDPTNDVVSIPTIQTETKSIVVSALGGVRFEYPAEVPLTVIDDTVILRLGDGAEAKAAGISLHSQLAVGTKISGLDGYLKAISITHDVTPTGDSIVVGDFTLNGYELVQTDTEESQQVLIFGHSRFSAPVRSAAGPLTFATVYLAETPSGILAAGVDGPDRAAAESMLPALGTLLATFEFVGPGLDPALPAGETIEPPQPGPPPPAADGGAASLPPLGAPFAPAEAGRHELLNFGLPISLDIDAGWFVQPNCPGVVVLTHPESSGPNDRDIVFINSIVELAPIASGPSRAGEPTEITNIDELIEDPPDRVTITNLERFELTATEGLSTTPVISFEITVEPNDTCSPSAPCDYAFITGYGFVKYIRPIDKQRVWWFPEHPNGPAAAIATAGSDSDWMTNADVLMSTLELSR